MNCRFSQYIPPALLIIASVFVKFAFPTCQNAANVINSVDVYATNTSYKYQVSGPGSFWGDLFIVPYIAFTNRSDFVQQLFIGSRKGVDYQATNLTLDFTQLFGNNEKPLSLSAFASPTNSTQLAFVSIVTEDFLNANQRYWWVYEVQSKTTSLIDAEVVTNNKNDSASKTIAFMENIPFISYVEGRQLIIKTYSLGRNLWVPVPSTNTNNLNVPPFSYTATVIAATSGNAITCIVDALECLLCWVLDDSNLVFVPSRWNSACPVKSFPGKISIVGDAYVSLNFVFAGIYWNSPSNSSNYFTFRSIDGGNSISTPHLIRWFDLPYSPSAEHFPLLIAKKTYTFSNAVFQTTIPDTKYSLFDYSTWRIYVFNSSASVINGRVDVAFQPRDVLNSKLVWMFPQLTPPASSIATLRGVTKNSNNGNIGQTLLLGDSNNTVRLIATVCFYEYGNVLEFVSGLVDLNQAADNQNALLVGASVGTICGVVTITLLVGGYFHL